MKILIKLLISLTFSTTAFATSRPHTAAKARPDSKTWGHFQIFPETMIRPIGLKKSQWSQIPEGAAFDLNRCLVQLKQKTCLTDPLDQDWQNRKCLPGSQQYGEKLGEITKLLPPTVQQAFCTLEVIYVEQDIESIGYAGMTEQTNKPLMGIKKEVIDSDTPASSIFSWKEQKIFGVNLPLFEVNSHSPKVNITMTGPYAALRYVLIHEMGHVIDFANNAQKSWSAISWQNRTPKRIAEFPLWNSLCYYSCGDDEHLNLTQVNEFYDQAFSIDFATSYSAINPAEDFAESFSFYLLSKDPQFRYYIETPTTTYMAHIKWLELDKKINWFDYFFESEVKFQ